MTPKKPPEWKNNDTMARALCVDSQSVLGRIGSGRLWGYGKHIFNCKIQPPNEAHKGHTLSGGWRSSSSAHILLLCNSAPSSLCHNNRRTLGIKSKFQNISSLLLLFPKCHQLCRFNFIARTFLFFPFFCCFVSLCYMLHRAALIGELTPLPLSNPNSR